jgi:hypothetical protein
MGTGVRGRRPLGFPCTVVTVKVDSRDYAWFRGERVNFNEFVRQAIGSFKDGAWCFVDVSARSNLKKRKVESRAERKAKRLANKVLGV